MKTVMDDQRGKAISWLQKNHSTLTFQCKKFMIEEKKQYTILSVK